MIDLKTILEKHPDCLDSRAMFKSILMDSYPSEKRTINILTILFECGIVKKIKSMSSIDTAEMQRLIVQAENEYGIGAQYSQEAILIWATAFDVAVSADETHPSQPSPSLSSQQSKKVKATKKSAADNKMASVQVKLKKVAPVEGDKNDYVVEQNADGHYYIAKFC